MGTPSPRFVVLQHTWNGVHYDVMLEHAETLRTWAVDEEIRPGFALRARPLPDHRRIYLDYEGPISGNRGRVTRLDRGTYEPIVWEPERVEARLFGSRFRGVLSLAVGREGEAFEVEEGRDWVLRLGNVD